MKKVVFAALVVFALAGCKSLENLTGGIAAKSLSGSGTVASQAVDIDPTTGSPRLKSLVITGDYASARAGDVALQYRRRKSPSIFNTNAISEEVSINYVGSRDEVTRAEELIRQDRAEEVNSLFVQEKRKDDQLP